MSECKDIEPLFTPYVDGEAPTDAQTRVEAHMRQCPPCREHLADEQAARDALQTHRAEFRVVASPGLRRRCEAHRPASARSQISPAPFGRRHWMPLSLAASFVLAVAAVFLYILNGGEEALAAQLAVDHVKCFQVANAPATPADAAALGREWKAARGWDLKVPESQPTEQLELLGVRRCLVSEGITAHVMYKWRGEQLSVFVLNSPTHASVWPTDFSTLGLNALIWSKGGRTYAMVTRARPSEMEQVAKYMRQTAE